MARGLCCCSQPTWFGQLATSISQGFLSITGTAAATAVAIPRQFSNTHNGKCFSMPGFPRRQRHWLGCPGWVSYSSVVLKGKTVFNFNSAPLPSRLAYDADLGIERRVLYGTFQTLPQARTQLFLREKSLSWSPHLSLSILLRSECTVQVVSSDDEHPARIKVYEMCDGHSYGGLVQRTRVLGATAGGVGGMLTWS